MPSDRHVAVREAGQPDQPLPVCRHEGTRDGNTSVAQDKMVPAGEPCQDAEPIVWQPMAMQVGDEPAVTRMRVHPVDEVHDLIIGQMVCELRADDEIEALMLIEGKSIN